MTEAVPIGPHTLHETHDTCTGQPSAPRSVIASNDLGKATSSFTGTVHGVIEGKAEVSKALRFSKPVTDRVTRINGMSWKEAMAGRDGRSARALASCDVLNLVLGPLDLDVLGLQVHLKRVVLDIVAVSGAGNLLGNLVCAVAGLLDGGLAGRLAQVRSLLNLILGALDLGPLPVG